MIRRLCLILLLSRCLHAEVMPEYQKYVDVFFKEYHSFQAAHADFKSIKVDMDHFAVDGGLSVSNIEGECRTGERDGVTKVLIDREYWRGRTELQKEKVILHELGHCLLNRDHLNSFIEGRPASLMYHSVNSISDEDYAANRGAYIQELFLGSLLEEKQSEFVDKNEK